MNDVAVSGQRTASLILRTAERFGLEPQKLMDTLVKVCFRVPEGKTITQEQMITLLKVCEAHQLDPFLRHVYALLDKQGNVVPFIAIDGWIYLVTHVHRDEYDGCEIEFATDGTWCTLKMWHKLRSHPEVHTVYLSEVKRGSTPWSTSPRIMLENRAYARCARFCFGIGGIDDEYSARERAESVPDPRPKVRAPAILQPETVSIGEALEDAFEAPPPVKSLASWMDEMMHAPDQESADRIVDEARGLLDAPQLSELSAAYRVKWTPE